MLKPSRWATEFRELQSKASGHWRRRQLLTIVSGLMFGAVWVAFVVGLEKTDEDLWIPGLIVFFFACLIQYRFYGVLRGAAELRETH